MATDNTNPVRAALNDFRIATASPLHATGEDATDEILPMIYSLATLLEFGFRRNNGKDNEAALENANPELVACALEGIAKLAAFALFASDHRRA